MDHKILIVCHMGCYHTSQHTGTAASEAASSSAPYAPCRPDSQRCTPACSCAEPSAVLPCGICAPAPSTPSSSFCVPAATEPPRPADETSAVASCVRMRIRSSASSCMCSSCMCSLRVLRSAQRSSCAAADTAQGPGRPACALSARAASSDRATTLCSCASAGAELPRSASDTGSSAPAGWLQLLLLLLPLASPAVA